MAKHLKVITNVSSTPISKKNESDINQDLGNQGAPEKKIKECLSEIIYVQRRGQLIKVDEVKLIWSNWRKEYKLMPSNSEN